MDCIQGERFRGVSDFTYFLDGLPDNYYNLTNTLDESKLKDVNIVYTNTNAASHFLNALKNIDKKFILITHSCDCKISLKGIVRPDGSGKEQSVTPYILPDNLVKWYSKNVNVINSRIESIPIGIENDRWFPEEKKKQRMLIKLQETKKTRNLVYVNINIGTNPNERLKPYTLLKYKPFATVQEGKNGLRFDNYIDQVYNHRFILCPEGNGMDTHRTWETLYMGSIPIEKRNLNNRFYTDLPICFIDDWGEITKNFLDSEFDRIKNKTWNFKMLTFEYWKDRILLTK